jgi:nitrogenase molybdenum-iron protein NifN
LLKDRFGVPDYDVALPVGLTGSDRFVAALETIAGRSCPEHHVAERGRLLDAMVDAHKVLFERRVALVGDQALLVGVAAFCSEIGLSPVLCASSGNSGKLKNALRAFVSDECVVLEDTDHTRISQAAMDLKLDLVIGPSKVRAWSRPLGLSVVHLGFPIHDRFGAARLRTFGYEGTLQLLDRITNALLERRQEEAGLGWAYL